MIKDRIISIIFILLTLVIVTMQYGKLEAGNNYIADLGYFVNNIKNIEQDHTRFFAGHFQPVLYIFKFIYLIKSKYINNTLILLNTQTIAILSFIYYLYKKQNRLLGILLIINPVIYNYLLFDFHVDFIAFILITSILILLDKKKYVIAILISYLMILVKEPYILISIMVCFYIILDIRPEIVEINKLHIFVLMNILIMSLLFIYIAIFFIPRNTYLDNTNILIETISGYKNIKNYLSIEYILTNSKYCAILLFPSIIYIGKKYKYLLLTIPLFLYIVLNPDSSFRNIYAHYNLVIIAPWIYGLSLNLAELNNIKYTRITILLSVLMLITVSITPISINFYTKKFEQFNFHSYYKLKEDRSEENKILNLLLDDNSESIIIQNNMYYRIFEKYKYLYLFPDNIDTTYNSKVNRVKSNYIVLNTSKQPYYYDKGCRYIYSKCMDESVENQYKYKLDLIRRRFKLIAKYNGLEIYKIQ